MGKGEVCGACTGALMALGLKYGESKTKSKEVCKKFLDEFKNENEPYIAETYLIVTLELKKGLNTHLTIIYSKSFVQKWLNPQLKY